MMAYRDNLPLDGAVKIKWPDAEPEVGTYHGYEALNTRRCAVRLGDNRVVWIDRSILEPA